MLLVLLMSPDLAKVEVPQLDPRVPLQIQVNHRTRKKHISDTTTFSGLVAEWSCSGLQIRVRRFDSDPGLQYIVVLKFFQVLC